LEGKSLADDAPDFEWGKKYFALAEKLRTGEKVEIDEPLPTPFTDQEMAVAHNVSDGSCSRFGSCLAI